MKLLKNNSYNPEKTAPTELDFFGRFSGLLGPLNISQRLLGFASGVLSGIVIAYIAQMQLPPSFPVSGVYAVMAASFVLGFIIFDGFYIYIAETFFRMCRDGSYRANKSMFVMAVFLFVIGGAIWYIDFINSTKAGEILGGKTAEKPPLQATDMLVLQQTEQAKTLTIGLQSQASLITQSVDAQIAAKESSAKGKIAAKEAEKNRFATLAADGNQWAAGKILAIDRSIAAIEAEKSKAIANVHSAAAKKMDKTNSSTDKALSKLTEQNAESVKVLNSYNTLRIKQFEDEYNRFSALGWLITAFLTIAPTLVTFLKVLIEVGSGIGIHTETRRRGFMSIMSAKWLALKEWFYDLIDKEGMVDVPVSTVSTGSTAGGGGSTAGGGDDDDLDDDTDDDDYTDPDPATPTPPDEDKEPLKGKQPTVGFFIPKNGFGTQSDDDCRNCLLPNDGGSVVIEPEPLVITTKNEGFVSDDGSGADVVLIARLCANIKALHSKIKSDDGNVSSNAGRILYLADCLTVASQNQRLTVRRKTPDVYKQQTAHLQTPLEAMDYVRKERGEIIGALIG